MKIVSFITKPRVVDRIPRPSRKPGLQVWRSVRAARPARDHNRFPELNHDPPRRRPSALIRARPPPPIPRRPPTLRDCVCRPPKVVFPTRTQLEMRATPCDGPEIRLLRR